MKKVWRIVALFLLAAVLGLPLGTYLVRHMYIDKEKALGMVNEEDFLDDFAKKEFIYGDLQKCAKGSAIRNQDSHGDAKQELPSGLARKNRFGLVLRRHISH